jgi:hypothetical protein
MSAAQATSPIEAIVEQIRTLSFTDMVGLNLTVATLIKKEAKSAIKKPKKIRDPNAPKKPVSVGLQAWKAFVDNIAAAHPAQFANARKPSDRMSIAKQYKEAHQAEYDGFVAKFKAAHGVPTTTTTTTTTTSPAPVVAKVEAKKEAPKVEAPKAEAPKAEVKKAKKDTKA